MATYSYDAAGSDPIAKWLANGAGTEKLTITQAGDVGIGITSPGQKLHINDTANSVYLKISAPATNKDASVQFNDGSANQWYIGMLGAGGLSDNFSINRNGGGSGMKLTIDASGNVGIGTGTGSVATKLHVHDSANSTYLRVSCAATTKDAALNFNDGSNNWYVGMLGEGGLSDNFTINRNGGGSGMKLTIDASGNVGIGTGTGSVGARLHAKSDGSSTDQLRIENSATGGKVWAISDGIDSANGQLSIRNQTNSRTIAGFYDDISGSGQRAFRVGARDGTQAGLDRIGAGQTASIGSAREGNLGMLYTSHATNPSSGLQFQFRNTGDTGVFVAGDIYYEKVSGSNKSRLILSVCSNGTVATEIARITEDGRLGLNTTSPSELLEVNGNARVSKLGINTAPTNELDVSGKVKMATNSSLLVLAARDRSVSGDPSGGETGALYFNTETNKIRAYYGGGWNDL